MNTFTWQDRIAYLVLSSPLVLFPSHVPWYMTIVAWVFLLRAVTPVKWHAAAATVLPVLLVFVILPWAVTAAIFA